MEEKSNSHLKIIKGAYSLFLKNGISASSTKEIAKVSDVNEVTIFRIFKTKKNLVAEVIARNGPAGVVEKFKQLKFTDDQEKNLAALTLTLIKYQNSNKLFMKFVFNNLTSSKSQPFLNNMLDPLIDWLEHYLASHTKLQKSLRRNFALEFSSAITMRSMRRALIGTAHPFDENDTEFAKFHARIFAGALRDLTGREKI